MSPTLLEIAVALVLIWIAWRIGKLLTPYFLSRRQKRPTIYPPEKPWSAREKSAAPHDSDKPKS